MNFFDRISGRVGDVLGEILLPDDIRTSHERANQAIQRKDYPAALVILESAAYARPEIERTHYLIGLCHFHNQDYEKSTESLQTALSLREDPTTHLALALTFEQIRDFTQAHTHFQRAMLAAKNSGSTTELEADIRHGLGRVYLAQKRSDKAINELRKALRLSPNDSEVVLTLADALFSRGNIDESHELMLSIQDQLTSTKAILVMAQIEEANHNPRAARTAYEKILTLEPKHREALIGAARSCVATSDYLRANEYLLRALEEATTYERAEVFVLLGQVNEAISNLKTALESYQIALQDDPKQNQALLGAGRINLLTEKADLAAEFFERAIPGPDAQSTRDAQLGLAKSQLALGDLVNARRVLENTQFETHERALEFSLILARVALASGDPAEAVVALREAMYTHNEPTQTAEIQFDLRRALARLRPDWALPETLDNPAHVMSALVQLREFIVQNPQLTQYSAPIQQLINQLDAPLSIAILGEFNAGKSTLINAILGEAVVPTGVLPTTAHPCIMQYGPRKATRIVYLDGQQREVDFDTARSLMKSEADQIERLDYLYPHTELRSVHFWDTPGFNALDERHEAAAQWAFEHAEAILWVLDANQTLSESEFERIETLQAGNQRLIILINKIDRLGEGLERTTKTRQLVQYVEEHIGQHIAGHFAISGLEALNARKADDSHTTKQALQDSGFDAFWSFLDARFIQQSGRLKALEISRQLTLLVQEIHTFGHELVNQYQHYGQQIDTLRNWLQDSQSDSPQTRAKNEANELSDQLDFVVTGIEREIAEALVRRGTWSNKMMLDEQDRVFILELLQNRLEGVLERSRDRVLDNITTLETDLNIRLGPIVSSLSLQEQRTMNRRIESFFDETRILKILLTERVYGQLAALARGQIQAGGQSTLREIEESTEDNRSRRAALIRELIPSPRTAFRTALAQWFNDFSIAAMRFCDRLQRDFMLLELEAKYRFDFSEILEVGQTSEHALN